MGCYPTQRCPMPPCGCVAAGPARPAPVKSAGLLAGRPRRCDAALGVGPVCARGEAPAAEPGRVSVLQNRRAGSVSYGDGSARQSAVFLRRALVGQSLSVSNCINIDVQICKHGNSSSSPYNSCLRRFLHRPAAERALRFQTARGSTKALAALSAPSVDYSLIQPPVATGAAFPAVL